MKSSKTSIDLWKGGGGGWQPEILESQLISMQVKLQLIGG